MERGSRVPVGRGIANAGRNDRESKRQSWFTTLSPYLDLLLLYKVQFGSPLQRARKTGPGLADDTCLKLTGAKVIVEESYVRAITSRASCPLCPGGDATRPAIKMPVTLIVVLGGLTRSIGSSGPEYQGERLRVAAYVKEEFSHVESHHRACLASYADRFTGSRGLRVPGFRRVGRQLPRWVGGWRCHFD